MGQRALDAARRVAVPADGDPRRIVLVASAGGHWLELSRLADAFRDFDCQFLCTSDGLEAPVGERPVLVMADGSRKRVLQLLRSATVVARVIRRFHPEIVVTTGAAPGAVALVVAWAFGIHTVWIESVSCRDELSMSGRFVRRMADLFVTQWPHISTRHTGTRYFGRVL